MKIFLGSFPYIQIITSHNDHVLFVIIFFTLDLHLGYGYAPVSYYR